MMGLVHMVLQIVLGIIAVSAAMTHDDLRKLHGPNYKFSLTYRLLSILVITSYLGHLAWVCFT